MKGDSRTIRGRLAIVLGNVIAAEWRRKVGALRLSRLPRGDATRAVVVGGAVPRSNPRLRVRCY